MTAPREMKAGACADRAALAALRRAVDDELALLDVALSAAQDQLFAVAACRRMIAARIASLPAEDVPTAPPVLQSAQTDSY